MHVCKLDMVVDWNLAVSPSKAVISFQHMAELWGWGIDALERVWWMQRHVILFANVMQWDALVECLIIAAKGWEVPAPTHLRVAKSKQTTSDVRYCGDLYTEEVRIMVCLSRGIRSQISI